MFLGVGQQLFQVSVYDFGATKQNRINESFKSGLSSLSRTFKCCEITSIICVPNIQILVSRDDDEKYIYDCGAFVSSCIRT